MANIPFFNSSSHMIEILRVLSNDSPSTIDQTDVWRALFIYRIALPGWLGRKYSEWDDEFDEILGMSFQQTSQSSILIKGFAQLISSQRWVPFQMEVSLDLELQRTREVKGVVGEAGEGPLGVKTYSSDRSFEELYKECFCDRSSIKWRYGVLKELEPDVKL